MKAAQGKTQEVIRWAPLGKKKKTKEESEKKEFGEILTFGPGGFVSPCEIQTTEFLSSCAFSRGLKQSSPSNPERERTGINALTCESEISEGFSVRLLLSAGIRSLYLVLTSSSE